MVPNELPGSQLSTWAGLTLACHAARSNGVNRLMHLTATNSALKSRRGKSAAVKDFTELLRIILHSIQR